MKKLTRVLSTLLALLMMLGSFTVLSVIEVGAAEPKTEDEKKEVYTAEIYNTPEEKLATMEKMLDRYGYQLYVRPLTGEIAVVDETGEILFSNPYDIGGATATVTTKSQLLSQISVQYIENGKTTSLYSFPEAAVRDQIYVSAIKNGVRVEYTIGREESRKLVPRWISKESFETNIKAPLLEAVAKGELDEYWANKVYNDYYELKSLSKLTSERAKRQLITDYPICEFMDIYVILFETNRELNMLEQYIKAYCEDYSFEKMDQDHEETGYKAKDEKYPMFKMALEYSLDENGLSVRMPCNGLRYDMTAYPLESISILPYMGAGNGINGDGYTFFPDGAGSLFAYKDVDLKEHIEVTGKIYGADYAYHNIENAAGTYQKIIRYPVYGAVSTEKIHTYEYLVAGQDEPVTVTVSNTVKSLDQIKEYLASDGVTQLSAIQTKTYKRGYVAIIEAGESLGSLQVYSPGAISTYNTVRNFFDPKPRDSYQVTDALSVTGNSTWSVTSNRKYTGSITIHYQLLNDQTIAESYKNEKDPNFTYYNTTWLGMAEAYRDYLCSDEVGILTPLKETDVEKDIPMYIETFGAMETQSSFLTLPITVMTPFTTFENINTMYSELSEKGVNNINFKLTGYANGGMYSTVPSALKWEKNVGGKDGFKELIEQAKKVNEDATKNFGIYPDFDFAYATMDTLFDSTNLKKDAVRTIDNRYTSKRMYSATQQKYVSFYQLAIAPSRYNKFYEKLVKNYSEYDIKSMSVSTLGNTLNSDFDEDEPYNREDSKNHTIEAFAYLEKQGYSLMTDSGNAFTWKHVDHMVNVDLDSSRYVKASASVPFIGAVLHGYVQFAGTPLNEEGDTDYAILKAIENGAGLYFILSYQNTQELKEDPFLSQYYSVRYDIWFNDMVEFYNELNSVMKDIQTSVIIDHYFINEGERVPDLDELQADIKNQLEAALKEELEKSENAANEAIIAVAEARSKTALLKSKLEAIIDEMTEISDTAFEGKSSYYQSLLDKKTYKGPKGSEVVTRYIKRITDALKKSDGSFEHTDVVTHLTNLRRDLGKIKNNAVMSLRAYQSLEQYKLLAEELLAEAYEGLETIRNIQQINPEISDELVAALVKEAEDYIAAAEPLMAGIDTDGDKNGELDYGVYLLYDKYVSYFDDSENSIYSIIKNAMDAVTLVGTDYEALEEEFLALCEGSFFTKQDVIDSADFDASNPEFEEEDVETTITNRYKVDTNTVVVVSYGSRNTTSFEKTEDKTFILNYNNYAVRITYEPNGITYTIPAGGYVVVD